VECSNGMILQGLKPRIIDRLKPYAENGSKNCHQFCGPSMGHTLFSLVYGSKAMLPTEVEHKSFYVQHFNEEQLDNSQVDDLTRMEELCEAAVIRSAKHQ
jgi:hypothetical protein